MPKPPDVTADAAHVRRLVGAPGNISLPCEAPQVVLRQDHHAGAPRAGQLSAAARSVDIKYPAVFRIVEAPAGQRESVLEYTLPEPESTGIRAGGVEVCRMNGWVNFYHRRVHGEGITVWHLIMVEGLNVEDGVLHGDDVVGPGSFIRRDEVNPPHA